MYNLCCMGSCSIISEHLDINGDSVAGDSSPQTYNYIINNWGIIFNVRKITSFVLVFFLHCQFLKCLTNTLRTMDKYLVLICY